MRGTDPLEWRVLHPDLLLCIELRYVIQLRVHVAR